MNCQHMPHDLPNVTWHNSLIVLLLYDRCRGGVLKGKVQSRDLLHYVGHCPVYVEGWKQAPKVSSVDALMFDVRYVRGSISSTVVINLVDIHVGLLYPPLRRS